MKKAAKASYNVVIGDDIRTLTSKNTKWYQKVVSGALIAANFIPVVGPAVSVTAKVAIKGTVATVKAVKTTSSAKKVATAANKKPKTVAAKSIKSTPKIQESKSVKANNVTPQAPPKVNLTKQPDRGQTTAQKRTATPDCEGGQCTVPGQCFIAGTKVITDKGEKPIEEIQVGDKVLSQNVETGEKGYKEVKQLFVHEVDTLYHVQIKGITISNTEEHPYWVVGKGWVEAKDLKIGDQVLLASGEKAAIENVTKEKLETPVKVYNFEVADWHTYFVADIGVLVHNDCTGKGTNNPIIKSRAKIGQEAHRQLEVEGMDDWIPEQTITLPNGKVVRKDGVSRTNPNLVRIIKPNTASGIKSANNRSELMKDFGYETHIDLYNPLDERFQPDSSTYIGPRMK